MALIIGQISSSLLFLKTTAGEESEWSSSLFSSKYTLLMLRIVGHCCVQYVQYQTMLQLHACMFHQLYKIKKTRQLLKPQASSNGATACVLKRKLSFRTGHLEIQRLSESVDFIPCIHTVDYDKRHVLRHILRWFWLAFAVIELQAWIIFSKYIS